MTDGADAASSHERARLTFDLDVDICIVGAGLAGLTVALEATRMGASVAVLEGRHVGWNASGNQLGTVMPGYSLPIGELIERVGFEDAKELWTLSKQGADYVRAAATEEAMPGIDCSVARPRTNSPPSFDSAQSSFASSKPTRSINS